MNTAPAAKAATSARVADAGSAAPCPAAGCDAAPGGTRGARSDVPLYVAEAFTSLAATWLSTGLYFVTSGRFGWGTTAVLALTAVQGAVYVAGSLLASKLSARFGRLQLLMSLYVSMGVLVLMCMLSDAPAVFIGLLLMWTLLCAFNWPVLEGLLCHGATAGEMSKRVGAYNLIWAGTSALAIVSISGLMSLAWWAVFAISGGLHLASALLVAWRRRSAAAEATHGRLEAPPELLLKRELARRLSRLALPASYTVIYALTPLLMALPTVKGLPEGWQSVAISVWLFTRVLTFAAMGMTAWWHGRPGLLLGAVVAMAGAFAGAVLTPAGLGQAAAMLWLVAAQAVLGVSLGMIYFGSLYFGMVLAHGGDGKGGSTEQGGYHEALIGAGTILGPVSGVTAAVAGVPAAAGVGVVVAASVGACLWTGYAVRRSRRPSRCQRPSEETAKQR
ncbi:MAG: MFS transporter [Tepidisphaerales bacterium]